LRIAVICAARTEHGSLLALMAGWLLARYPLRSG
jgi:hypothetical protein